MTQFWNSINEPRHEKSDTLNDKFSKLNFWCHLIGIIMKNIQQKIQSCIFLFYGVLPLFVLRGPYIRSCGFFSLFLVRVREQTQCGRAKGKKQTHTQKKKTKKNSITSHMAAHVPSKSTESRRSTCNRKTVALRTQLCISEDSPACDCLTVERDPLRKHVQLQIYNDHGSLSAWRPTV